MSTPDGKLPRERGVATSVVPTTTDVPSVGAPSPGLARARAPGSASLPDFDPAGLGLAVSRMANELFARPPLPGAPDTTGLPASRSAPHSAEPRGAPFAAPLSFAGLSGLSAAAFRLPLVELTRQDLPSWLRPPVPSAALSPPPSPAPPPVAFEFEFDPITAVPSPREPSTTFDVEALRAEFPILDQHVNGKRLVWLDNAATTQKPRAVILRLTRFYERENSNIHRAAHTLAARASDAYESARDSVKRFINAPTAKEIIFVRGATEGINLIAQSWGKRNVRAGDEIVVSWLEHHANIVPWQRLCEEVGAHLRVAPVDDTGQIIIEEYEKLLGPKTRLVSFTQVSNALGTITPARQMIELAHRHGAKVLLDGAQAVSHMRVDVQRLDCDFYVFSGHKVFAPTGIGAVFGKTTLLEEMPPWQGGGNMIADVTFERSVYQPPPARFEAGTGNIADAVGLGAALDWLTRVGIENVTRYEHELLDYATACLATVRGLTMIGTAANKAGVLSFILAGQKTEAMSGLLDKEGIAVRSGHHCAQPILRRFGVEATVRASLAPYNTRADIDALTDALHHLQSGGAQRR